jgi:hypothetical protein
MSIQEPYRTLHYHFYPARLSFHSAFWEVLRTKWWMWWFLQAQWCFSIRGCCTERDAINTAHAPGIPCALEMGSGSVHMVLFMFYTYFILLMVLLKVLLMFTWCVLYVCWILVFVVCPLLSLWFLLDLSRIILCLCPNMKKYMWRSRYNNWVSYLSSNVQYLGQILPLPSGR